MPGLTLLHYSVLDSIRVKLLQLVRALHFFRRTTQLIMLGITTADQLTCCLHSALAMLLASVIAAWLALNTLAASRGRP